MAITEAEAQEDVVMVKSKCKWGWHGYYSIFCPACWLCEKKEDCQRKCKTERAPKFTHNKLDMPQLSDKIKRLRNREKPKALQHLCLDSMENILKGMNWQDTK